MRRRKRLTTSLLLGATLVVACVGVATAYEPLARTSAYCPLASYSCGAPGPEVTFDARFRPIRLPKTKLVPVHLELSGRIATADGSHPPAPDGMVIEVDRDARLNARGLPVCRPVSLEAARTAVPGPCKGTRVGEGEMEFEVAAPESAPFTVKAHAVAFNGRRHDGARTILIHAYLPSPVAAVVVIRVKVTKIHRGRYGTQLSTTIPSVADGYGSMTKLELDLFRSFTYRRRPRSYLLARCGAGELQARMEWTFREIPTVVQGVVVRPCTAKR